MPDEEEGGAQNAHCDPTVLFIYHCPVLLLGFSGRFVSSVIQCYFRKTMGGVYQDCLVNTLLFFEGSLRIKSDIYEMIDGVFSVSKIQA